MSNLSQLKPQPLWENFGHICSIPHPSKHEGKILEFLLAWAKKHNITVKQDETGNLIFSKPATKGMENRKGIILQGHIDMVPQKNSDKVHDFTKDPIEPMIGNDGWIRANGTTLGADNGIGCAAAMSVLQATDIEHGPIEVLVTVDEETGMTGAFGLKPGLFKGDILMNLDSEDEGELYVGCAGGLDATIEIEYKHISVPANMKAFKVAVTGLKGGHSGMDINTGRANANKIIIRLLKRAARSYGIQLASIDGGSLRNAIPREAFATITLPENKVDAFHKFIHEFRAMIQNEFSATEPTLAIDATPIEMPSHIIENAYMQNIINVVYGLPNGVMRMSDSMKNLVETSTNLAIVKSEKNKVTIMCLLRSSVDSAKEAVGEKMSAIAELANAKITLSGAYPGWKPNMESPILKTMQKTYQDLYGKTPEIKAIHAGLECGLLGGVYPNWDMISFGPTIRNPHSPDERVHIESVEKFWNFLIATLKNVPLK
ncbi:MAG: aminoacyl-histidine dipeptidase [Bacteroidales bacterium]|jgi:dipeptidase D|nr:aminoacyl-histidine dipeptidase [Bacteroidales bacterium]